MPRFFPALLLAALPILPAADVSNPVPPLPPEVAKLVDEASTRTVQGQAVPADDPIMAAWMLSRLITGDHDAACLQQFRCVEALVEKGRVVEAARLTLDIADYRSAMGSLLCAEAFLAAGKKEDALKQIERVERVLDTVKTWQQHAIRVRMAGLGALAGWDDQRVAACIQPIDLHLDRFGAELLVFARQALSSGRLDLAALEAKLAQKPEQAAPAPEMIEASRLLLRLAEKADADQREAIFTGITRLCALSHAYHADLLLDEAFFWYRHGDEARARKAFGKAEPQFGFHLGIGGRLYYRMAALWKLRGKSADIRPYFERLENKARGLAPMDRPAALAWMAASWGLLGEEARGEVLFGEALKEAAANENPRMRLIGGVEICLCHALAGRALSGELASGLQAVLQGAPLAVK